MSKARDNRRRRLRARQKMKTRSGWTRSYTWALRSARRTRRRKLRTLQAVCNFVGALHGNRIDATRLLDMRNAILFGMPVLPLLLRALPRPSVAHALANAGHPLAKLTLDERKGKGV